MSHNSQQAEAVPPFAPPPGYAARAFELEMAGANRSYAAGFGMCEWESFLDDAERAELNTLAELGFGTWGRERHNKVAHPRREAEGGSQ